MIIKLVYVCAQYIVCVIIAIIF